MPRSECATCHTHFYAPTKTELLVKEFDHYAHSIPPEAESTEHMCKRIIEYTDYDDNIIATRQYGNNRLLRDVAFNSGRCEHDF